jgi:thymidylate kinase
MAQIVEFFGPIGAGKTTVCQELESALAKAGISVVHRKQIRRDIVELRQVGAVLCRRVLPLLHRRYIRFVSETAPSGDAAFRERVHHAVMMWWYSKFFLQAQVALFDHLIFQRFVGLCLRSAVEPEHLAERYLAAAPRADLIVHLDTPADLAFARVLARQPIPLVLMHLSKAERERAVAKSALAARMLADQAIAKGFPLIRCDGEAAAETNAAEIMRHLVPQLSPAPS